MTRTKEDDGETKNGKKKSWIPSYVSTYTYKHLYYTRGEGGEQLYIYQDLHESKGKSAVSHWRRCPPYTTAIQRSSYISPKSRLLFCTTMRPTLMMTTMTIPHSFPLIQ